MPLALAGTWLIDPHDRREHEVARSVRDYESILDKVLIREQSARQPVSHDFVENGSPGVHTISIHGDINWRHRSGHGPVGVSPRSSVSRDALRSSLSE